MQIALSDDTFIIENDGSINLKGIWCMIDYLSSCTCANRNIILMKLNMKINKIEQTWLEVKINYK